MTTADTEFAPAKINLTLHVTGRRGDGYHLLDSLVVFASVGDTLSVAPRPDLHLSIDGPEAHSLLPVDQDNLVLRAARLLDSAQGAAITLHKNLPVASGIGGGSSNAAAALRLLSRFWNCPLPDAATALQLGADLPVCLTPRAQRMSGIGETLAPVPPLPDLDIVLVNPRRAVSTPLVFAGLATPDGAPMPKALSHWQNAQDFAAWLRTQRTDLTAPACDVAPAIAETLSALAATECLYAGMSGSGATCFALFPGKSPGAVNALTRLRQSAQEWWSAAGQVYS